MSSAEAADAVVCALAVQPLPLLAVRLPEFERIAWRAGKREARRLERRTCAAFVDAARRLLRHGDVLVHDVASDVFAIVMAAPSRENRTLSPLDCRAVLERVAAALSLETGLRVESGWTFLREPECARNMHREIEAALERGARERERYEFFAALGHELRTPLTSIRGYIETLLDGNLDAPTSQRFLETARREAQRMGRLLDGIFDFSLLDLSAAVMAASKSFISEQVGFAAEAVRPLAQRNNISLRVEVDSAFEVALDADACLQLFVNLLENGIKYGRSGGALAVSAFADERYVTVYVDDDGPGIAPSERESIFNLRVRGSNATARPGTGIGLAIVKVIVERAGGEIRVKNSPLGGARFQVTLPRRAESEAIPA
ncbi:MAG: HAMP domain-containing histidine kinase [Candidatus Eremiobacteraeota bacterium]|nr:HAMP domain-containing histidine kinase [Candidatus Eremiobacteraeota bacterium]